MYYFCCMFSYWFLNLSSFFWDFPFVAQFEYYYSVFQIADVPSASSNLLFFIYFIVVFNSDWLFFILSLCWSSLSLYTLSSSLVGIFITIIMNSLSGRFLNSILFTSFSDVLSCSFVWRVVLCLSFYFIFLVSLFLWNRQNSYLSQFGEMAYCKNMPWVGFGWLAGAQVGTFQGILGCCV